MSEIRCPSCGKIASEYEFTYRSNKLDKRTKKPIEFQAKQYCCGNRSCVISWLSEEQERYIEKYLNARKMGRGF